MHNLSAKGEAGVVRASIEDIRIHPDWDPYFTSDFNADLAILVLSENVSFTNTIRPVCLPADSTDTRSDTIDLRGTVVGWGQTDDNNSENIQREASIIAVNDTYCYHKDEAVPIFSSNHTFCGGFGDGYATFGDSGGGYFILDDMNWVQYGVISATRTNRTGHVLPSSVQIYTNLRSFKQWIVSIVKETGGEIGEATEKIEIICDFTYQNVSNYGCIADAINVQRNNIQIRSIVGTHINGKSNDYVEYITFLNGSLTYLPRGVGNFFPNLKIFQVGPGLGMKRVTRSCFTDMKQLEKLQIFENSIEAVEEDSLWDLEKLETFELSGNEIFELNERFFEKNERLRVIILELNKLERIPKNLFRRNSQLTDVDLENNLLHLIDEQTFSNNVLLQYVDLSSNHLDSLPSDLFKYNLLLKYLFISHNLLKTIDEKSFQSNINLVSINLSTNRLEHLTENIFKNNSLLEHVNLSNNSIKTMEKGVFRRNSPFKIIDLSLNELELPIRTDPVVPFNNNATTALEEGLFDTNARTMELSFNHVEYLPNTLFMNNLFLASVYLQGNSIRDIDENCFENNLILIFVDLSFNRLNYLPEKLFQSNSLLNYVSLKHNSLRIIDADTFAKNMNLLVVDLTTNRLESVPRNLLKNNLLLQSISLRNNSITLIDENIFDSNIHLRVVDLSLNQLELIPRNLFKNNLELEYVLLEFNRLKFIEFDFTKLKRVKQISLFRNDCTGNSSFKRYYESRLDDLESIDFLQLFQESINNFCSGIES